MKNAFWLVVSLFISFISSTSQAEINPAKKQEYQAKYCVKTPTDDGCSEYSVEFPQFDHQTWLNQYIETNVRRAITDDEPSFAMPWPEFLQHYAKLSVEIEGDDIWTLNESINVESIGMHDSWVVLAFSTYQYYKGTPHGMPSRYFRVLNIKTQQTLTLDDIL
ncbi:hypothetical protein VQ643_12040 [Pseudomonas sp. F1_0610]|uniref:hypothetical protein n=1 Tax=Pseudomonas sp. F1_0610 TaxID=3114284 RepID=UPI0039C2C001